MLKFIAGLAIGLALLVWYQKRSKARLKELLGRINNRLPLPDMGYDAQLASAMNEQRAQVEDLAAQARDFRQLLQQAPVGYLQVDEENQLLWCNHRAQAYLNIDKGDYAQPRLLLAVVRSYELDQLVERTRLTQKNCEACWTFNSISPDPFNYSERPAYPLQGYGVPLRDGQVGIFLENKQEAVSLAQQRDRWISDVAHELKTPLTSIRLVAERLQPRVAPDLTSWVERLLKEVIRLSKLVDDVLNMSRLEQQPSGNKEQVKAAAVDLVPLVRAAWQSVEPLARLKQVQMSYEGPDQLVAAVDSSLMHRVLFNLFSNAVRYSPFDEKILVRLGIDSALNGSSQILLEVIDSGKGLADQDLPHVFERFYRADSARSRATSDIELPNEVTVDTDEIELTELSSSGTGLGLAIVRQIVESYQGQVEARNSPETGGGWLRVWLPAERLVELPAAISSL